MNELSQYLHKFINNHCWGIVLFIFFLCLLEYWEEQSFKKNMHIKFDYLPKPKRHYERRMEDARSNINKINRHR